MTEEREKSKSGKTSSRKKTGEKPDAASGDLKEEVSKSTKKSEKETSSSAKTTARRKVQDEHGESRQEKDAVKGGGTAPGTGDEGAETIGERGKPSEEESPEQDRTVRKEAAAAEEERGKKEPSEEEFRRLVEESLERVTVADIVLTMMNQLASLGYLKMGLPESVNLKYRDLEQALLAIDVLEALIKGTEGKISEDSLRPFRGTLANLQLNFVQLKRRMG